MAAMTNGGANEFDVVVIGAGPAGIMASGMAARQGQRTALLERNATIGRKLQITGGGRCNISTRVPPDDFMKAFGREGQFLRPALAAFGPEQLEQFLAECDIHLVREGAQCFVGGGGSLLVDGLRTWLRRCGVRVFCDHHVTHVTPMAEGKFEITTENDRFIASTKVIITAGGKSYPRLGTEGDGFAIARELGHKIMPAMPAMGPIHVREPFFGGLAGISLPDVEVEVLADGKREGKFRGGFLVTHSAISGPAILNASLVVARALQREKSVLLQINFLPSAGEDVLERFGELPQRFRDTLKGLADIEDKNMAQVSKAKRRRLVQLLTQMRLTVASTGSWDEGMVTVGGVSLKEVDPRTMESKIVKGVYFAGEVLDLAGHCGGYNIQAALSMGYLAGSS